jgi:hypothetical protein
MQGIYTYIPETSHVPREYTVAVILSLLFMVPISPVPALALLFFYVSTFRSVCAVPNMAVFCSSLTSWFPGILLLLLLLLLLRADKTKYMVISRDQNAGRTHSMKIHNGSFERVEEFKYLETTLTYKISIQEEIKSRLKSGNACYHSVQNLLSSGLLSKNIKIEVYRNIILPCCFVWV